MANQKFTITIINSIIKSINADWIKIALIVLFIGGGTREARSQSIQRQVVVKTTLKIKSDGKTYAFARPGDLVTVIEDKGEEFLVRSFIGAEASYRRSVFTDLKDAAPVYDALVKKNPKDVKLYLFRAQVWAARNEPEKVISDYTKALELNDEQSTVYVNRGVFYANLGEFEKAIDDYRTAIKLDPQSIPARINLAAAYLGKKDYDLAIESYTELIKRQPQNPHLYLQRGAAYRFKQDWEKAIADFNAALEIDPNNLAAIGSRGFVYYLKRDHQKAVDDFSEVIRHAPEDAMAYNNRGYNRQMLGDFAGALEDFEQAIKLAPEYAMALQNKGWLLATCPDKKYRDGVEAYKVAKKACELRDWEEPDDLKALAAAYAESRDFGHAVEFQERVIKMTQGNARTTEEEILKLYKTKQPFRMMLEVSTTDN